MLVCKENSHLTVYFLRVSLAALLILKNLWFVSQRKRQKQLHFQTKETNNISLWRCTFPFLATSYASASSSCWLPQGSWKFWAQKSKQEQVRPKTYGFTLLEFLATRTWSSQNCQVLLIDDRSSITWFLTYFLCHGSTEFQLLRKGRRRILNSELKASNFHMARPVSWQSWVTVFRTLLGYIKYQEDLSMSPLPEGVWHGDCKRRNAGCTKPLCTCVGYCIIANGEPEPISGTQKWLSSSNEKFWHIRPQYGFLGKGNQIQPGKLE